MSGYKDKYTLGRALGQGGFAEVFVATDRATGDLCALKRLKKGAKYNNEAHPRMRREIDVQQAFSQHNIMPILDWDTSDEPSWFTMPIAQHTVEDHREVLASDEEMLIGMINDVVHALQYAHKQGHVHRDVAPQNILFLEDRWVLADWGLVRRPLGETTTALTHGPMGHMHYMAPEMFDDSHGVTGGADVYSLGRILMYVFSGRHPKIMTADLPTGGWRRVVSQLAHVETKRRPSVDDIPALVASSLRAVKTSVSRIRALLQSAPTSDKDLSALVEALNGLPPDREDEVFVDLLPAAPRELFEPLLAAHPNDAVALAERIRKHVETANWHGRDFNTMNEPLAVLLRLAAEANRSRDFDVLGPLSEQLFELDVHCDRFRSKGSVRDWLVRLRGRSARIVADALARVPGAIEFYGGGSWAPTGADPAISDVLTGG